MFILPHFFLLGVSDAVAFQMEAGTTFLQDERALNKALFLFTIAGPLS